MEETKELTLPEQARDQAKNYFRQGMNCTECVMQSFLDIHGSDLPPEVIALATVLAAVWDTPKTPAAPSLEESWRFPPW